jgi:hypothetical protein
VIGDDVEERVLGALAGGASRAQACRAGPISQRSLRRRLRDPEFAARLSVKRDVVSREIDANLRALASRSVLVITKILSRDDLPALQLKAALAVLAMWARTRPFESDERLEELEALALDQDTQIRNLNEGIERVATLIMANYSQTNTRGAQ